MKSLRILYIIFILGAGQAVWAGNPERAGEAGATQLLINPYARSSGVWGFNAANCYGVESIISNPAGLAHTSKTEVVFSRANWIADIGINTLGVSQRLGENGGVLGVQVMAYAIGDIQITTIDNPDGGLGYYSPTFFNVSLSYGRTMLEDHIYVGATVKLIHESIPDVSANGLAFDAGAQYRDKQDRLQLGVSLRNVGPEMSYQGDGMELRTKIDPNKVHDNAVQIPTAAFQIPSQLQVGIGYTLRVGKSDSTDSHHKFIPMLTFVSNSFSNDQYFAGLEYRFNLKNADILMVRASYAFEDEITSQQDTRNAFSGLALGATVEIPLSAYDPNDKKRTTFGLDYSFRPTHFFNTVHSLGVRINL